MKKENSLFVYVLVVFSLFIGVLALFKPVQPIVVQEDGIAVGGQSGQDQSSRQFFGKGMTEGGSVLATSTTAATYTMIEKDLRGSPKHWVITPANQITISLSSTSTRGIIPNIGDTAELLVKNASTTAGSAITFAAVDTGVDFQKNEDVADLAIAGLDWAKFTVTRTSKYAIAVLMEEFTEAD